MLWARCIGKSVLEHGLVAFVGGFGGVAGVFVHQEERCRGEPLDCAFGRFGIVRLGRV